MALMNSIRLSEKKHSTRSSVVRAKEKRRTFDGASPRLYQPTYAGANVGHPDRVGVREEWMTKPRFILTVGR